MVKEIYYLTFKILVNKLDKVWLVKIGNWLGKGQHFVVFLPAISSKIWIWWLFLSIFQVLWGENGVYLPPVSILALYEVNIWRICWIYTWIIDVIYLLHVFYGKFTDCFIQGVPKVPLNISYVMALLLRGTLIFEMMVF